jgi:hypothetical protein
MSSKSTTFVSLRKFAIPERPRATYESITLRLQFLHSLSGSIHIQLNKDNVLSPLLDKLCNLAVRACGLNQLESDIAEPVLAAPIFSAHARRERRVCIPPESIPRFSSLLQVPSPRCRYDRSYSPSWAPPSVFFGPSISPFMDNTILFPQARS